MAQARKEAEARVIEERRLAEEERRLNESRWLRELEYEGERLRLQARLEEEEEQRDPESLANRLRDFESDEKEDQRLEEENLQSTPLQVDDRTSPCNTTQRTERRRAVQKLPETLKTRWGEKRVEMLPKTATLADLDKWLRERVRAKSLISDQTLNSSQSKEPKVTQRERNRRRNNQNRPPRNDARGAELSTLATRVNGNREPARTPANCPVCTQAHRVEDCLTSRDWMLISVPNVLKRITCVSDA